MRKWSSTWNTIEFHEEALQGNQEDANDDTLVGDENKLNWELSIIVKKLTT